MKLTLQRTTSERSHVDSKISGESVFRTLEQRSLQDNLEPREESRRQAECPVRDSDVDIRLSIVSHLSRVELEIVTRRRLQVGGEGAQDDAPRETEHRHRPRGEDEVVGVLSLQILRLLHQELVHGMDPVPGVQQRCAETVVVLVALGRDDLRETHRLDSDDDHEVANAVEQALALGVVVPDLGVGLRRAKVGQNGTLDQRLGDGGRSCRELVQRQEKKVEQRFLLS